MVDFKTISSLSQVDEVEILEHLLKLTKSKMLEQRWYTSIQDHVYIIKLRGIIHYEQFFGIHNRKFIEITIKILQFINRVQRGEITLESGTGDQIGKYLIKKFLNEINIPENEFDKVYFTLMSAEGYLLYGNACGFARDDLVFYGKYKLFITDEGKEFLELYSKLINLFSTITNPFARDILLSEYQDIKDLWYRRKWKDIAIKMGSILDYLTYDYFDKNSITIPNNNNPFFHDRLLFLQKTKIIGSSSDWFQADNILRYYRNCVHLQEIINKNIVFNETMIKQIFPVFEKLIGLF